MPFDALSGLNSKDYALMHWDDAIESSKFSQERRWFFAKNVTGVTFLNDLNKVLAKVFHLLVGKPPINRRFTGNLNITKLRSFLSNTPKTLVTVTRSQ